jgi:hypothetical protein
MRSRLQWPVEQQLAQAFMGWSTLFSNRDLASYHGGDVVQFDVLLVSNGMMPSSAESNFNINTNYTYKLGHSANSHPNKTTLTSVVTPNLSFFVLHIKFSIILSCLL